MDRQIITSRNQCAGPDLNRMKPRFARFPGFKSVLLFAHCGRSCAGPDLNRRTPTGQRPKRCAFGLARQPARVVAYRRRPKIAVATRSTFKYLDRVILECVQGARSGRKRGVAHDTRRGGRPPRSRGGGQIPSGRSLPVDDSGRGSIEASDGRRQRLRGIVDRRRSSIAGRRRGRRRRRSAHGSESVERADGRGGVGTPALVTTRNSRRDDRCARV